MAVRSPNERASIPMTNRSEEMLIARAVGAGSKPASADAALLALIAEYHAQEVVLRNCADGDEDAEGDALCAIEDEISATPAATPEGLLARLRLLQQELHDYNPPDIVDRLALSPCAA